MKNIYKLILLLTLVVGFGLESKAQVTWRPFYESTLGGSYNVRIQDTLFIIFSQVYVHDENYGADGIPFPSGMSFAGNTTTDTYNTSSGTQSVYSMMNDPASCHTAPKGTGVFYKDQFNINVSSLPIGESSIELHKVQSNPFSGISTVYCNGIPNVVITNSTFTKTNEIELQQLCLNDVVTLDDYFYSGEGRSVVWSGPGVSGNQLTITSALPSSFNITATSDYDNGDKVLTYTVNWTNVNVNAGSNQTVCSDDAPFLLTGFSPNGGVWSGPGISGNSFDPGAVSAGNNVLTYTVTSNGCSYSDTKSIVVNTNPVVNAGTNVAICRPRDGESANTVFVTNGATPGGGTWSCSNCAGFTLNSNGSLSNDAPVGTYNITYSVTSSGCTSTDSKTFVVNEPPTVSMPADPTVCTGDDYQIDPTVSGTGLSYSWTPTTNLSDPFRRNPTVSNVTTTTTYTLTVTSSNGCNEFSSITIIHDPGTAVDAGPNITNICESDALFNITGASPAGGTWSGPGVSSGIFNPGSVTTGVDHTITYTLINGNGCETSDTRIFRVNAEPVVDAGPDTEICFSTTGSVNVNVGALPAGGVWSCPTCPSGTITNSSTGAVRLNTTPGTYEFIYTYTNASGCVDFDTKDVTWNPEPIPVAIADQEICELGQSVQLDVNVTGGSGGISYSWSPTASLDDPFSQRPIATPTNTNTTYTVTITDAAGCTATDNVVVTVTGGVTADAGSDFSVCADQPIFNLTGGTPAGGTWSGSGVVSGEFFDASSVPPGLTYELTYSYTDANGCFDDDTRLVTVNNVPTVNISGDFDVCLNEGAVTLSGGSPAGGSWSGNGVSSGQWFPAVAGVGIHTLTYTYTNGNGCSTSETIQGRVFSPPSVNAGLDQTVCINGGVITLNGFNPSGSSFTGPGIISSNQFDPSVTGLGTYTVTSSFTDGNGCTATDTKNITVVNFVDVGFVQSTLSFCRQDAVYNLNSNLDASTPSGGTWSGNGVSGVNFNPSSVSEGTYQMTYTYTNGAGCEDSDVFDVVVTDNPTVSFLQNSFELCSDESPFDLALASPSPLGGTWSSPYVTAGQFDPSLVPNEGVYQVTYTVSGSCTGTGIINITVDDPTPIDAGPNRSFCSNDGAQLISGASVSGGTWGGSGVSGNFFDPSSVGPGTYTITYDYTNNDGCLSSDTRVFTVNAPPVVDAGTDISLCANGNPYSLISDVNITGGSFSSNNGGVVGLNFDPSLVSAGIYEITYTYTDPVTNCTNDDSRFITVINPQNVTVGGTLNVCIDGGLYDLGLVPVSITGGTWDGPGVSGTDFNPASAGVGSHSITYTVIDGNGCETSREKTIVVEDLPTVNAGSDAFVCSGAPLVALDGTGTPSGGVWSGTYVVGGNFDVTSSGSGTFTVTYTYTNATGCTNSDTKDIIVDAGTVVNAGPDISACESEPLLDLASRVSPGGGSFVGPGINGNNFDPSIGPGTYTITYNLANEFGCTGSDNILITVNPDPIVEAGTDATLCFNESPLDLTLTANPQGGTFSGPGVVAGSYFDPTIAGTGSHLVTYVYENASGCIGSDTRDITVTSLPFISAGNNMFICVSNGLIDLDDNASPDNGTWTGTGVTNGIFDPASAGVGQHVVTYTIVQGNGCTATDTRVIQIFPDLVVDVGSDITTCTNGGTINLNENVNVAGGDWSGTGVFGSTFNPSSAGPGVFPLVYEVTDQYGCDGMDVLTITVHEPQTVNVGSDISVCVTAPSINLGLSVSPAGGTFTGSGVSGNMFDPSLAGIGNHDITYTVVDANGCTATNERRITVTSPPSIDAGNNRVVCLNSNQIDLDEDASIAGGIWNGNGVVGSFFDPALAGVGSHVINYQLDDGNGCISSDNVTITVRDNITVDAGVDLTFCINGNSYDLSNDANRFGGIWSGPGINNDEFNPFEAGVGIHTITYTFQDAFSCLATDTKVVTVNDITLVDAGPDRTVCSSSPILDLTAIATPSGGTWFGAGVSGGAFNPGVVGTGTFDLTYRYTDGNGCTSSDIRRITVVDPDPIDIGDNLIVCLSSEVIDLDLDNSQLGGIWSGSGVTGNLFNPNLSGIGLHTISYVYDDGSGCISSATKRIDVRDDITIDAGSDISVCVNSNAIDLNVGVSTVGGVWSGIGVSGTSFDPEISGVGNFVLTYAYTNGFGCEAVDTRVITVTDVPLVDAGPTREICVTADPIQLNLSANPAGGTWTGAGISAGVFDPSAVGIGSYDLLYTYVDGSGCVSSDTRRISVVEPDQVNAGSNRIVCVSSNSINLDLYVSDIGGTWDGQGIISNIFDPSLAGIGSHSLVYTYNDGSGCISSDNIIVQVRDDITVDAGNDLSFCLSDSEIDLSNDPSRLGGTWSGPGIDGDRFDPLLAGTGSHVITYYYSDEFACSTFDTRIFNVFNDPFVDAGPDLTICTTNGLLDLSPAELPSGGNWSGQGVIGNFFDPSLVGSGRFTLTYTYTNGSGCTGSATREINVELPQTIDAGPAEIVCLSSSSIDLDLDVNIQGGFWSGNGVSGGFFTPITAGVGTHVLTYTVDNGLGCVSTDTRSIQVRNDIVVDAGPNLNFCLGDNTYDLTNDPNRLGGDWSGPGVSGRNFNPEVAGVGTHILTYFYSDDVGCDATDTRTFTVNALTNVDAGPPLTICSTNGIVDLSTSVFPSGGVWSGPGITGNYFDPLQVGEGSYDLVYSFIDINGCENSDVREITVDDPPNIDAGPTTILCLSSPSIDLDLEVSLAGGSWSGLGVSGSFFEPATAGVGTHTLTYTYNFGGGCIGTDSRIIQIRNDITVDAGEDFEVCINSNVYDLTNDPDKLGGDWSGPGISRSSFNPSVAGIGTHTLTYYYEDAVGCTASDTRLVTVNSLSNIDAGPDAFTCRTASAMNLDVSAFPSGGVWSGPGVIGNEFYPSQVGTGNYLITYTYVDGNSCEVSDTRTIFVNDPTPIDAGANLTVCSNSESVDLDLDVSIQGGVWSGPGLDGSFFNPGLVPEGVYTLTYTVDDGNGCISTDSRNINVRGQLDVDLGDPIIVCVNESLIDLNVLPSLQGGTWFGPGVISGNFFNPTAAGSGNHTLNYEVENEFGCIATNSLNINVLALTAVSAGADFSVCISEDPVDLAADVFPTGGIFVGDGIIGSTFYPEIGGAGVHTITYEYEDGNGCISTDSRDITVYGLPIVDAGSNFDLCVNANPVTLQSIIPTEGGTWSGSGIVSGVFNPLDAGIGTHNLAYLYTDNNGCFNSDTIEVTVLEEPALTIGEPLQVCVTERPIDLSVDASIQGGTFTGTGVTGRLFNPSDAGVGTFIISYEISYNGCTIIAFRDIQVNNVTPIDIGEDRLLCIDSEPLYLLGDVNQVGGVFSGPGVTGDQFDPILSGLGSHIIEYTYINAFGCESRDTRIITVQEQLDIDAGPDQSICASVATFDLTGFGRPAGGLYIGTGVTENIFDPNVTGIGDFTVTYVLESDNGCVSTDEMVITVSPSDITDFGQDTILCITSSPLDLNFNSELAQGSWDGPGVVNNQFFPSLSGIGGYTLTYTNSTLECDIVGRRSVTVVGLPQAASSSQTSISACIGEFVQLDAEVSEEDRANNVEVHWFREDSEESFARGELINYEVLGDERIYFESVNAFGCGSGQTSFISINKNNPEGSISVTNQNPEFGESVQFFAEDVENAVSYRWDFGDGTWSEERNPFHFYYDDGSFNVSLTLESNVGCKTTIIEQGYVNVGQEPGRSEGTLGVGKGVQNLPDAIVNQVLVVRPNPVKSKVTVELMANASDKCLVSAIYLSGQVKDLEVIRVSPGVNEIELDLSGLKAGLYPIIIRGDQVSYRFNVIKVD